MIYLDDKLKNLNKKVTSKKTKYVLIENELKKLQTINSSLFNGHNYFRNDRSQNLLIFESTKKKFLQRILVFQTQS